MSPTVFIDGLFNIPQQGNSYRILTWARVGTGVVIERLESLSVFVTCSRLSDSGKEAKVKGAQKLAGWEKGKRRPLLSPVSSRFIFVFALFQFSGPDCLRAWNRLNCLQMSFQKQHIFVSYLKTLSVVSGGPARVWTRRGIPHGRPRDAHLVKPTGSVPKILP